MALNFGLGFSFGAQDKGLSRALSNLSSEFKSFGKEMLSLQRFQTMLSALSFDRLDDLGSKLKELGTGGMELTSSFESTMTGFNKEMRKFGAMSGKTGADLSKFSAQASSMAYGLNISADVAGKAIYGFEAAYEELDATGKKTGKKFAVSEVFKQMGIDSAATLAKFSEVTGKSGDEFSYSLMNIAKSTGMGAQGMGDLTNMIVAFGQKSNTVSDSLGKIDEIGSLLSKRKLLGDTPEQVAAFGKGIVSVAESFYQYKQDGTKAMQVAMDVANAITQNKDEFKKLQAGAADALPELTKVLGKAGMGVEQAFKSMGESPDQFLKQFAEGIGSLSEGDQAAALEFFRSHVGTVFGDSTESIVSMLKSTEGRAALMNANVSELVKASSAQAGKLAKDGYSSGLTAAEAFERQQTAFMQRFRNLTTLSTSTFLKETQKSFNSFAKMLEQTASKGGPLGMFVRKMADVQKFGAAGLFPPNMQGPLVALGQTAEALISPLAKLRAAGIDLASPFGMLAGAVGAFGTAFMGARMSAAEQMEKSLKASKKYSKKQIEQMMATDAMSEHLTNTALKQTAQSFIDFFKNTLPQYASKAIKFISAFARQIVSGGFTKGFVVTGDKETDAVLNELMVVLKDAFNGAMEFAKDLFKGLWGGLMGDPIDAQKAGDAEVIGAALGQTIRKAFDFVVDEISSYLKAWWGRVTAIWNDQSLPLDEKIKQIFGESVPLMIGAAILSTTAIGSVATSITTFLMGALARVGWEILKFVFVEGMKRIIWPAIKFVGQKVLWPALQWIGKNVIWAGLRWIFMTALPTVLSAITSFITTVAWPAIQGLVSAVVGALSAPIIAIVAAIGAFFVAMFFAVQREGDEFSDTWDRMWGYLFASAEYVIDEIWAGMEWFGANTVVAFKNLAAGAQNALAALWDGIKIAGVATFNFMVDIFNKLVGAVASPIQSIMQMVGKMLVQLADAALASPALAGMFGITPERAKSFKEMAKSLAEITKQDAASLFKVERATAVVPSKRVAYTADVAKRAVESRDLRLDRVDEDIQFRIDEREAAAKKLKAEEALKGTKPLTPKAEDALASLAGTPSSEVGAAPLTSDVALSSDKATAALTAMKAKTDAEAMQSKKTDAALLDATNNPAWAESQLAELKAQNDLLKKLVDKLSGTSSGSKAPAAATGKVTTRPMAASTTPVPGAT